MGDYPISNAAAFSAFVLRSGGVKRTIAAALTATMLSLGWAPARAGVIHSYDFTANTNDGTGTANASVIGSVGFTTDRFGVANHAMDFTGGYLQATFPAAFTNNMTFSLWATRDTPPALTSSMLFDTGPNSSPDLFFVPLSCAPAGGRLYWNTFDSCGNPISNTNITSLLSGWHNYTVVAHASSPMELYIDGVLIGTAGQRNLSGTVFDIGGISAGFRWDGKIDDVKIYDTALTATQVAALVGVPEPSTLALFGVGLFGFCALRRRKAKA